MSKSTKAALEESQVILEERLAELELQLEDIGWIQLNQQTEFDFSREGLARIVRLAQLAQLKNPLINHAVEVTSQYVFGQGVSTLYEEDALNEVWQGFWDDPKNRSAFSDHGALIDNEQELETTGNLFFALFTNISTGRVRVRGIPVAEIQDIICNPEDAKEPWFYRRVWGESQMDLRFNAGARVKQRQAFYPDVRYWPASRPSTMANSDKPIFWDSPVYHTKVGGSAHMKFGVPEVYPALDWAKAAKEALEDFATTHRALARFAWQLTAKGKRGVAAAKTKLSTTLSASSGSSESNPPPGVGSAFIGSEGANMQPIQTRGMAPPADEGRMLWLMVAAGVGIPHTILAGDADVGNLATAKTLDRPTELKMTSRQMLWTGIFGNIGDYVLMQAVGTPSGALKGQGTVVPDASDNSRMVNWRGEINDTLDVDWPPILERDTAAAIEAIVKAVTLDGKVNAGLFDNETIAKKLLQALGEDEIDEIIKRQNFDADATEASFGQVLTNLKELVEASKNGA